MNENFHKLSRCSRSAGLEFLCDVKNVRIDFCQTIYEKFRLNTAAIIIIIIKIYIAQISYHDQMRLNHEWAEIVLN